MNPRYIVLHHSLTKDGDTVSWDAIRQYHIKQMGMRDIGYHFGIELIGQHVETLMGRSWLEDGAHCKQSNMNGKGLGICFVGNYDLIPLPQEHWQAGITLCLSLMGIFYIPPENVITHNSVAPHKSCPGSLFDIAGFQKELRKRG